MKIELNPKNAAVEKRALFNYIEYALLTLLICVSIIASASFLVFFLLSFMPEAHNNIRHDVPLALGLLTLIIYMALIKYRRYRKQKT